MRLEQRVVQLEEEVTALTKVVQAIWDLLDQEQLDALEATHGAFLGRIRARDAAGRRRSEETADA